MSTLVPAVPPVSETGTNEKEHRREIAKLLNTVLRGKLNATLSGVTLTANAASTTLTDSRIGFYSWIWLMPTTAHAAAELASGNLYFDTFKSGAGKPGSCIIHHSNNAESDRTYVALIIG